MTTDAAAPQQPKKPQHVGHTLKQLLEQNAAELQKVLPKHLTLERLLKVALYCIEKVPKLQQCTIASLVACVKQLAELGLEPGGALGLAYLVPFDDKKTNTTICTVIIGYRGFIDLARRSGKLSQIEAHVIHEHDDFQVEFGLEPVLRHKPKLDGNEGKPKAVYCVARLVDGGKHVEVMPWEAVMRIKARSRSSQNGPWVTDEEEMARKTVVRRAAKYLPLSPELADALNADGEDFVDGEVVAPTLALAHDNGGEVIEPTATQRTKERVRRKVDDVPTQAAVPTPPPAGSSDIPTPEEVRAAEAAQSDQPF